jgi:hypothetical protein
MTSNKKVITMKVVGNFKLYDLESIIIQNGVLIHEISIDY